MIVGHNNSVGAKQLAALQGVNIRNLLNHNRIQVMA